MRHKQLIRRGVTLIIGGFLLMRPLMIFGVSPSTLPILSKEVMTGMNIENYRAFLAVLMTFMAYVSGGLFIISLGFDSLRRFSKPIGIFAIFPISAIAAFVVYTFFQS